MTEPGAPQDQRQTAQAPPPPAPARPAQVHRTAADSAAAQRDFPTAVRERFRALNRGLEQSRILPVDRTRTAVCTGSVAAQSLPDERDALAAAAQTFDEVVYGARPATEADLATMDRADRFSMVAPPPLDEPADYRAERTSRRMPDWLVSHRLWIALMLVAIVGAVIAGAASCSPPSPPTQSVSSDYPDSGGTYSGDRSGDRESGAPSPQRRSLLDEVADPVWAGSGVLALAVAISVFAVARRGLVPVPEDLPVVVPADELTAGHAELYRRSGDRGHLADVLRGATIRRIAPVLGIDATAPPGDLVEVIATAAATDVEGVRWALSSVPDTDDELSDVAARLDWIEERVRNR
ncbi:DUF4129 domain-containing protein [Williamsia sp. CHRR-6]|uniref:DUF4129 domain-containing protein n=1 Tax=Williamsia sp. CHRR-6 TaxID=2835871 RepID=UPI001BDA6115|nr:DUF4129 domain-containing protein [Williamsia sp. CHRR-6]MBT0565735.1 DUF4129 domain-containing protein [Williamsia sp. CHRR-6]